MVPSGCLSCGGDGRGAIDIVESLSCDVAAGNWETPGILDIRVKIDDEFSTEIELNSSDNCYVVASSIDAVFVVQVETNVSGPEDVGVNVIDIDGKKPPELLDSEFRNGLWRLTLSLRPGSNLSVIVTDPCGGTTEAAHCLRLPTQLEALVGTWRRYEYSAGPTLASTWLAEWSDDGTWAENKEGQSQTKTGTWTATATGLSVSGIDVATGRLSTKTMSFVVGQRTFTLSPYKRVDEMYLTGSNTIQGAWERKYQVVDSLEDSVETKEVTDTLAFSDGHFIQTITRDLFTPGSVGTKEIHVSEGTFAVWQDANYISNNPQLLVLEPKQIDGTPVSSGNVIIETVQIDGELLMIGSYFEI